jgi:hypothetical protein
VGESLFTYGIVLFILGIALLVYLLIRIFKRFRYRDTGDPQSGPPGGANVYLIIAIIIFISIGQSFLWLSSQLKYFRPFGEDGKFATLHITRTGDGIKSLEMMYIPAVGDSSAMENLFYLSGDSWKLRGEVLKFKFLAGYLGLPDSCYKTVEFNSKFQGRLPPDIRGALLNTEIIEGGESGAFRFFRDTGLFKWFAESDSFSTDYERIDNSVGYYLHLTPDGTVDLR